MCCNLGNVDTRFGSLPHVHRHEACIKDWVPEKVSNGRKRHYLEFSVRRTTWGQIQLGAAVKLESTRALQLLGHGHFPLGSKKKRQKKSSLQKLNLAVKSERKKRKSISGFKAFKSKSLT